MSLPFSRRVLAPAPVLWDLLTTVEAWPHWGPSVLGARLDDGSARIGPGSTGQVRVPPGVWIPFRVTSYEEGVSWSWSVAGVPATGHTVATTRKGCRVTFHVPWWAPAYGVVCLAALVRLERLAAED
ncbi:SRPBCC family protein [Nocardioides nanhaiensis]|uniref:SRPBCC family protein n=1 Tax=Nocardioides nanhaiensis TaxID=1476871 RepID=A0ABP8WF56_9ACTN